MALRIAPPLVITHSDPHLGWDAIIDVLKR
jgi:hypothetical protein